MNITCSNPDHVGKKAVLGTTDSDVSPDVICQDCHDRQRQAETDALVALAPPVVVVQPDVLAAREAAAAADRQHLADLQAKVAAGTPLTQNDRDWIQIYQLRQQDAAAQAPAPTPVAPPAPAPAQATPLLPS